jgi:hypothetical protein
VSSIAEYLVIIVKFLFVRNKFNLYYIGGRTLIMNRRYALRDDQWKRIKDFLPGRPGYVGANGKDNRLFIEAVLYRYRAGIP